MGTSQYSRGRPGCDSSAGLDRIIPAWSRAVRASFRRRTSLDKRRTILGLVSGIALLVATGREVAAQAAHAHTPAVSGMPQGVPLFCSNPTVTSVGAGPWSKATTWSTGQVPGADDRVAIGAGHSVSYDVVSDAKIGCIEVSGTLAFSTKTNTRLNVVTLLVV